MQRTGSSGYDAFISYSHALDGKLAPAIRLGLHRFPRPWLRPRAARVFYDTASLSPNDSLWHSIEAALRKSRCLILLASPDSATSFWVNKEVELWRAERSEYPILLVLTSGHIVWGDGDFMWARTNAVPAALQGYFVDEPLWLDLRWAQEAEHLTLRDPRFRDAVATLAATVHDRPKDELIGADIRMGRRQLRLAVVAIVALTVLSLLAVAGGVVAYSQRNQARVQAKIALSRQLAAQASTLRTSDPATSLMLDVEALRTSKTAEATNGLSSTLSATHYLGSVTERRSDQIKRIDPSPDGQRWFTIRDGGISGGQFDGDRVEPACGLTAFGSTMTEGFYAPVGGLAAIQDRETGLSLWDVATPCRPKPLARLDSHDLGDPFSGRGSVVFSRQRDLLFSTGSTELFDVRRPGRPRRLSQLGGLVKDAALTPSGRTLLTTDRPGQLITWDISDPSHPRRGSVSSGCERIEIAPDGETVALIYRDAPATLWHLHRARLSFLATLTSTNVAAFDVAFSEDGTSLVTGNYDSTASLWDVSDPSRPVQRATLGGHQQPVTAVAFVSGGREVLTGDMEGRIHRWSRRSASEPDHVAFLRGYEGAPELLGLAVGARETLLVSDGTSAAPELWATAGPSRPRRMGTLSSRASSLLSLSVGRDRAMTVDDSHLARIWDLSDISSPRYLAAIDAADGVVNQDGRQLVTVDSQGVGHIWALTDAQPTEAGSFGGGLVRLGTTSPDGDTVPAWSADGLELWDISRPDRPLRLATLGGQQVAWSPDGGVLSITGETSVQLINVTDLRHPKTLSTIHGITAPTVFSPSGQLLAAGDENAVPSLWDVSDRAHPTRVATLVGHRGSVYQMVFSANGDVLFTGSYDKSVGVWDVKALRESLNDPIGRACDLAGPGLSRQSWDRYLPDSTYHLSCR